MNWIVQQRIWEQLSPRMNIVADTHHHLLAREFEELKTIVADELANNDYWWWCDTNEYPRDTQVHDD